MSSRKHSGTRIDLLDRLKIICSPMSPMKSDEQLRASFESFLANDHSCLDSDDVKHSNYFTIVEEIIEVLHELEEQLMEQGYESQSERVSEVDSSNHLYASLKRHPE